MTTPDYSDLVARLDKLSNGTDLLGRMPSNVDYEDGSDSAQTIETLSAEVARLRQREREARELLITTRDKAWPGGNWFRDCEKWLSEGAAHE